MDDIYENPDMMSNFKWYDMTREEKMEHWWKRYNLVANIDRKKYFDNAPNEAYGTFSHLHLGNSPLSLHFAMFFKTFSMLASDKQ